jgi:hypothetical protein
MTSKPFGVNLTLLPAITPPDYVGYAKIIVEEGINIVETAGNNPRPVIEVFKAAPYKIFILHKYDHILLRTFTILTCAGALLSAMLCLPKSLALTSYRLTDSSALVTLVKMMFLDLSYSHLPRGS